MSDLPPGAVAPPGGPGPLSTRTDRSPGQPIRVPTGVPYGQAKQIENAQQAIRLPQLAGGGVGTPPATPVPQPGSPSQGPAGGPGQSNPLALLSHPTQRPNEPMGTMPQGMTGMGQPAPAKVSDLLDRVARQGGIASLSMLADRARSLGQ